MTTTEVEQEVDAAAPTLHVQMNVGPASLERFQTAVADLLSFCNLAHDLTLIAGVSRDDEGKAVADVDWWHPREDDEDFFAGLEHDERVFERDRRARARLPITSRSIMIERRMGATEAIRIDFGEPSTRISHLRFSNPLDAWLQLLGGTGVLTSALLLGRYLRDFGAERRKASADAAVREADAKVREAEARDAAARASVAEQQARTAAALHRYVRRRLVADLAHDDHSADVLVDAVNVLVPLSELERLARVSDSATMIEDGTGKKPW